MLSKKQKINLKELKETITEVKSLEFTFKEKVFYLKRCLENICLEITFDEKIQFSHLYSRIIFIAQKYNLPQLLVHGLQQMRLAGNKISEKEIHLTDKLVRRYIQTLCIFIDFMLGNPIFLEDEERTKKVQNVTDKLRVQITQINHNEKTFECVDTEDITKVWFVKTGITDVNNDFNKTFDQLWIGAQLNLINYKIENQNHIIPQILVLEPDYLIDASAISECIQNFAQSPLLYTVKKFEQTKPSQHLLMGNLANYILDELIYSDAPMALDFNDVFLRSFKQMPFEYTVCKDIQDKQAFVDFMAKARRQFVNISRVVTEDMPELGFKIDNCILEPSFYSEKYGFQGRLDLLESNAKDGLTKIIELKSGKTPFPCHDPTQVGINHEVQIAVYRLMIEGVFNKNFSTISSMALYSSADNRGENLRLVTPPFKFYKFILDFRNQIIAIEHKLYTGDSKTIEIFLQQLFNPNNYGNNPPAFFTEKLNKLEKTYTKASKTERIYFLRFIRFIIRELYITKLGDGEGSLSLAALWNTDFNERKDNLELISDLKIKEIQEEHASMSIIFENNEENSNANFRIGEICVLYPKQDETDTILSSQILKGTITRIDNEYVTVRFRFKQKNRDYLNESKKWVIEHDKLDHSMNAMFKSLYAFLDAPKQKKDIILGYKEPQTLYEEATDYRKGTIELYRKRIIEKALSAKDYFLIVGPPGTGKTSVFAKNLIEKLYNESESNILVIAYTNRAVDELCAAISEASTNCTDKQNCFIRIGSSNNCATEYEQNLLQNIALKSKNRQELTNKLQKTRIYVGTLAAIVGKPELFEFKHFNTAIIDEASQILEPQIIGLLPLVDKFIMIGDHKQLSTITQQHTEHSKVTEPELNNLELYDCRESIFERLFRLVTKNNWHHAYDTLNYHGRMHQEIADLVNNNFYDGILTSIAPRQKNPIDYGNLKTRNELQNLIVNNRKLFFHTINNDSISNKINRTEAILIGELVENILLLYKEANKDFFADKTLGIITPYRNQIATIKSVLREKQIPDVDNIMIDTVERYQGSQRDIIIVSFCFNNIFQLRGFMNLNRNNTVDRKLNVALTRAREQLFLIGNKEILERHPIYQDILNKIQEQ